uniref:Putative secreted protein n=1 Tax=Anopheles marajoara TaxID=58244 RepID=A0A2M4CBC4_9DIPT
MHFYRRECGWCCCCCCLPTLLLSSYCRTMVCPDKSDAGAPSSSRLRCTSPRTRIPLPRRWYKHTPAARRASERDRERKRVYV